ncbi:hypothetical protein KSS87_022446 [Heliosperma pusillum]|nr:hypothetical protein KSS87_022446 [Heliosperma pusillum]
MQGVPMQTKGNDGRLIVHLEVRMQTLGNERTLIVHTRSYNENNG